ncbi:Hypothetical protein KVN_LOCUS299 [uncultured virus]|nr:Hypothetical protein KVN_LOCUS299 [uncultured virus]
MKCDCEICYYIKQIKKNIFNFDFDKDNIFESIQDDVIFEIFIEGLRSFINAHELSKLEKKMDEELKGPLNGNKKKFIMESVVKIFDKEISFENTKKNLNKIIE